MAKRVIKGLSKVEWSPLASDGDVGTTWTDIGLTARDATSSLTTAEGTVSEIYANETDTPVDTTTTPGVTTLDLSVLVHDEDSLVAVLGGTKTGTGSGSDPYVWNAADVIPELEKSFRITTRSNDRIIISRTKVNPLITYDFGPDGVLLVNIKATMLQPLKSGVKKMTIGKVPTA